MRPEYDRFRDAGAGVVAVSFEAPARVAQVAAELEVPFPLLADPGAGAYRAMGLGSVGWADLLRPHVIAGFARLMLRGRIPTRPTGDVYQLGGDFLIGPDRALLWAHRSRDPVDRPSPEAILNAWRAARPSAPVGGSS